MDGSSCEPLTVLLSFFERLKNNDENSVQQSLVRASIKTLNMSEKKLVDEPKPKRRKGLRR